MITGDIKTIADLEDELSRPSEADAAWLQRLDGDILILGAGGKMGPSLARLCRRAADAGGPLRGVQHRDAAGAEEKGPPACAYNSPLSTVPWSPPWRSWPRPSRHCRPLQFVRP